MNKVIDTSTRSFMVIVRPSGSGKTELILKLLMRNTFHPKFATGLRSEFEVHDFQRIRICEKFKNVPLVFGYSCEDIYNDKKFVRLATAGRHRGLDV